MLHELKKIFSVARQAGNQNLKMVLASVVALDGSSYRRPGVRMLILEDGTMVGAVSGGCVEKEIARQSQTVFDTGQPKLMIYDGRYRLGCDGILYILIEIFRPSQQLLTAFDSAIAERKTFSIRTYFSKEESQRNQGGSAFVFSEQLPFSFDSQKTWIDQYSEGIELFQQTIKEGFRLIIAGAEHDAVSLSNCASQLGWEVWVIAPPMEDKNESHFPGIDRFLSISETEFSELEIDEQTAVVIMMHGLVKDLSYLMALRDKRPAYLGLLGPSRRREKIINEMMERDPDTPMEFIESIRGPAGINIGAETGQEIAISIVSEILSVTRNQTPVSLKDKKGGIHE